MAYHHCLNNAGTGLGWCGSFNAVFALGKVGKHHQLKYVDITVEIFSSCRSLVDLYAIFFSSFFTLQPYAEDVLHNVLLQSFHHHETDRKQVRQWVNLSKNK